MSFFHAFLLGIVEGITEFLPISSTGHLILAGKLLGIDSTDFSKSFEIIIQMGAILAVVVLYWKRFWSNNVIWKKILTAFIPTGILGLILYKIIKKFLLGNSLVVVISLLVGGVSLIVFELWQNRRKSIVISEFKDISYKKTAWIGVAQSLAMIPGVSRSAATIVGGMIMGIKRETIVEFSFLLAVPTMAAATGLDLLKSAGGFSVGQIPLLLVGFITSFVVAIFSIKFLLSYIQKHTFIAFGVYRIIVAVVFWIFLIK